VIIIAQADDGAARQLATEITKRQMMHNYAIRRAWQTDRRIDNEQKRYRKKKKKAAETVCLLPGDRQTAAVSHLIQ